MKLFKCEIINTVCYFANYYMGTLDRNDIDNLVLGHHHTRTMYDALGSFAQFPNFNSVITYVVQFHGRVQFLNDFDVYLFSFQMYV